MLIMNLIVLAFCLFMVIWWGTQGFFSSLLQLVIVITASACTFGLWEPLMMSFLIKTQPLYSRGVSFMALFIIFMVIFRAVFDGAVRQNVHFNQVVNHIGGGICGFLLGVITAGMMILGLSFLPVSASLIGYQPFIVGPDGKVTEQGSLWLPVDRWTSSFFNTLSGGSFATDTPLRDYSPDLYQESSLFRMRNDPNSSLVVIPGSVEVEHIYVAQAPVPGLNNELATGLGAAATGSQTNLFAVQTKWSKVAGTYDGDSTLRVPPAQVRLVVRNNSDGTSELASPIAFSYLDIGDNFRYFHACDTDQASAYDNNDSADITWFFSVPSDRVPTFFMARLTRVALPDFEPNVGALVGLLGGTKAQAPVVDTKGNLVEPPKAQDMLHVSSEIPMSPRSKNATNGTFEYDDEDGTAMIRGKGDMRPPEGVIPKSVQVTHIKTPKQQACVQYRFDRPRARSLLGAAVAAAASLDGLWIEDNLGNQYQPIGYAWVKDNNMNLEVSIDPEIPIKSMREFPSASMREGETLYVYFFVNRGVRITKVYAGKKNVEAVALDIPDK